MVTFNTVKGSGSGDKVDHYKMQDGNNSVRLFGPILPRYLYWPKSPSTGKGFPFECLEFNRETEKFDRAEKDYVKEYFPDIKCQWAYSMMCLDNNNNSVVFDFKKKLFDQIMSNIPDLGDPTDPETGWVLKFEKKKTGPLPINVEYTLQTIKCMNSKGPLSEDEKEAIAKSKTISELLPRPTPEDQKAGLERFLAGPTTDETIDETVSEELSVE